MILERGPCGSERRLWCQRARGRPARLPSSGACCASDSQADRRPHRTPVQGAAPAVLTRSTTVIRCATASAPVQLTASSSTTASASVTRCAWGRTASRGRRQPPAPARRPSRAGDRHGHRRGQHASKAVREVRARDRYGNRRVNPARPPTDRRGVPRHVTPPCRGRPTAIGSSAVGSDLTGGVKRTPMRWPTAGMPGAYCVVEVLKARRPGDAGARITRADRREAGSTSTLPRTASREQVRELLRDLARLRDSVEGGTDRGPR